MTVSSSPLAYADCYSILDQALEDQDGVRVATDDIHAATYLRMRIHQARKLDREKNATIYEPDDVLFNRSTYDTLVIRIKQSRGKVYLYVEHVPTFAEVEKLSELEDEVEIEAEDPPPEAEPVSQPTQPAESLAFRRRTVA